MVKIFTQATIICLGMCMCVFTLYPSVGSAATITDFKIPENFRFNKDIHFGSTSRPDVSYLQNILNMSTSTRVATSGAGSLKNPSNFYGVKTRDAVARFQKLFAVDIEFERSISTSSASSTTSISSSTLDVYTRTVLNKLIIIYSGDRQRYKEYLATGKESATTEEVVSAEIPPAATQPGGGGYTYTGGSGSQSSSFWGSVKQPHELIYQGKQFLFRYSPQGQLLNAIGGEELVDSVFNYTPAGLVGQATGQGNSGSGAGAGLGMFGAGGSSSGGSSGSSAVLNFGGMTTAMTTCTCSANILLYVQDVRGTTLPLIYQPGATILYQNYSPTSGVWVLGTYTSGGQCLIYAVTGCTTGGTPVGTMLQVGTSLSI